MKTKLRVVAPDDTGEPIDRYMAEVKAGTTSALPYERLMIYYRKRKEYKEELAVIEKGIKVLKTFYNQQLKQTLGRKINPALRALSDKISRSTGLHDKKGNELYLPEPLPKWIKRKSITEEKLKKQTATPTKKKKKK